MNFTLLEIEISYIKFKVLLSENKLIREYEYYACQIMRIPLTLNEQKRKFKAKQLINMA